MAEPVKGYFTKVKCGNEDVYFKCIRCGVVRQTFEEIVSHYNELHNQTFREGIDYCYQCCSIFINTAAAIHHWLHHITPLHSAIGRLAARDSLDSSYKIKLEEIFNLINIAHRLTLPLFETHNESEANLFYDTEMSYPANMNICNFYQNA